MTSLEGEAVQESPGDKRDYANGVGRVVNRSRCFRFTVRRLAGLAPLVSLLYPPTCVLCGAPGAMGRDLCAGCDRDLPRNLQACPRCALPLDGPAPQAVPCGRCQKRAPPFDRCLTAFRYDGAVPSLEVGLKFRGRLNLARLLGQCLAERIRESGVALPEVLVPVPLHPGRLRKRGYNQALEVARWVGRELDLPVDSHCCVRTAATLPQTGLDERARRRNLRGAFDMAAGLPARHLAILDDVVTTGSTVSEMSRVLRRAGAERIQVWAVARTP